MFEIALCLQAHRSVAPRSDLLSKIETNEYAKQSKRLLRYMSFYEPRNPRVNEGEYKALIHYLKWTDICFIRLCDSKAHSDISFFVFWVHIKPHRRLSLYIDRFYRF